MEEAEHALWRSAGLSIAPTRDLAFPRVAAAFEYRRPLRFEDEFDILIQIAAITERNLEYRCRLTIGDTLIASGSMTVTCVRMPEGEPMKRTPFPAHITSRLEAADGWHGQQ
jgi:acyl-CoA thioesterase FadM